VVGERGAVDSGKRDWWDPSGWDAGPGGLLAVLVVLFALSGVALPASRAAEWGQARRVSTPPPLVVQAGQEEQQGERGGPLPVSCPRARALVIGAHPELFALLQSRGLRVRCGVQPLPGGERLVWVSWQGQQAVHEAIYRVTPDWAVHPGDATARLLEELADYGPLARPVLEE